MDDDIDSYTYCPQCSKRLKVRDSFMGFCQYCVSELEQELEPKPEDSNNAD